MGQVASDTVTNLAYFSRTPTITEPLVQNPVAPPTAYNASKTYVAFVVGDGDNVGYIKGGRYDWMQQRLQSFQNLSFPLLWSMSPHALYLCPDLLQWYYNASYQTGLDYFVLPPSGYLYSYPGEMEPADQARFVAETERVSHLLNTSASVEWEFFGTWRHAIETYLPRYSANNVVRGFFPVNVPFLLPIEPGIFTDDAPFITFSNKTVLFHPREWRGTSGSNQFQDTPAKLAAELNGLPGGSVRAIYMTSDGGLKITDLFEAIPQLSEHVEVVDHEKIVHMALQSGRGRHL